MKIKNKLDVDLIDSDVTMTIDQLITNKGYNLQIHYVTTQDGYILKLFRILPRRSGGGIKNKNKNSNLDGKSEKSIKGNKKVVLLQHGLFVKNINNKIK
jgi:hypothetical protein